MPIRFTCKCGRRLRVADAMAGQVGNCPACGVTFQIPRSSDAYDPAQFLDGGDRPCPACRQTIPAGAVVCAHCGYHRVAATRVRTTHEAAREDQPAGLRWLGGRVPAWAVALGVILLLSGGVWFWLAQRPAHLSGRQYVFVTEALAAAQTRHSVHTVGGEDALLIVSPDEAGDHLLLDADLRQSVIDRHQQIPGNKVVFDPTQFKLQPADGSAPLAARVIGGKMADKIVFDLSVAGTSDYHALFPPPPPVEVTAESARGVTLGTARWLSPGILGDLQFSSVAGVGGMANTGGLSARGSLQMADPVQNVIDLDYTGKSLVIDWPDSSAGWWSRKQLIHPSRASPALRQRVTLLMPRPANPGRHTLLYCDEPIGSIQTASPPPRRAVVQSPLKPRTAQQRAAGQAAANNPLNYFSSLAQARGRARGIVSASHMNQFSIAIQMFVDEKRRHPVSLLELIDFNPDLKSLLHNPRTGDMPGFIYEPPPPPEVRGPGVSLRDIAILWESLGGQKDPSGAVLYADGHME